MNFKKLPLLGAPTAFAFFLATAGAMAKDLDAQALAKMSEASAVRVACGVADVSFISPAAENGNIFVGSLLALFIAIGAGVLVTKKGVKVHPVVAWVLPLLVVLPTLLKPFEMANLMALPFAYAGFGQMSAYAPLLIFAVCAIVLFCKTVKLLQDIFTFRYETKAYTRVKPRTVRRVVYKRELVQEETLSQFSQPIFCEFSRPIDVESARASFEKTYNDDTACLSR